MQIRVDDLSGLEVQDLLRFHVARMLADSPPGHSFALDLSALRAPGITVWTAWEGEVLLGVGALKALDDGTGEVKSMRTHPDHLGKGVGQAMLEHIVEAARAKGMRRLSLETGDGPAFEAALALYRKRGFVQGEAFGDYRPSAFNQFFHLDLG